MQGDLDRVPAGEARRVIALFQLHGVYPHLPQRIYGLGTDPDEAEDVTGRKGQRVPLPLICDSESFLLSRPGHEANADLRRQVLSV